MPIDIHWFDKDKTIIYWQFNGIWDWEDYHGGVNHTVMLAREADHCVHVIYDLTFSGPIPVGSLIHGARAARVKPDNLHLIVVIGGGSLIRSIITTFCQLNRQWHNRILAADSPEQAVDILTHHHAVSSFT